MFIIYLDYVLRTSIDLMRENGFTLEKARSKRQPAQTITDANYADDIAFPANALAQAKSMLHSLEQAAGVRGLHENAHKMDYMCFNQRGDITQNGGSLKPVDKFTHLGSSVLSTGNDNTRLAMDRSLAIWKPGLSNKIKHNFFPKLRSNLYYNMDAPHGCWLSVLKKS